jgi:hypothetical protein
MLPDQIELLPFDPGRVAKSIPDTLFAGPLYNTCLAVAPCAVPYTGNYVMPPLDDNDFRWVLPNVTADQRNSLLNDEYRLIAYYDRTSGRLWIALDLTALRHVLAGKPQTPTALASVSKLHAVFDPGWLWLNANTMGNKKVRDLVTLPASDARIYRRGEISAAPGAVRKGLRLDAQLAF